MDGPPTLPGSDRVPFGPAPSYIESGFTESTRAPIPDVSGSAAAAVSAAAPTVESAAAPAARAEAWAAPPPPGGGDSWPAPAPAAVVSPYAPAAVAAVSTAAPACAAAVSAFAPAACSGGVCPGSDLLHPAISIAAPTTPALIHLRPLIATSS